MATLEDQVVVMAKVPVAGQVKTRLAPAFRPDQAAAVHSAMLQCVLDRLTQHLPGRRVLALAGVQSQSDDRLVVPDGWFVVQQGAGDLGQRMGHVWAQIGAGKAVFFGSDSPDVPKATLGRIWPALADSEAVIGPSTDGGYWALGAARFSPVLLDHIDWGGSTVYDQTRTAAWSSDIRMAVLPLWHDVDHPADLSALRCRLESADEPSLVRLRRSLRQVCDL